MFSNNTSLLCVINRNIKQKKEEYFTTEDYFIKEIKSANNCDKNKKINKSRKLQIITFWKLILRPKTKNATTLRSDRWPKSCYRSSGEDSLTQMQITSIIPLRIHSCKTYRILSKALLSMRGKYPFKWLCVYPISSSGIFRHDLQSLSEIYW